MKDIVSLRNHLFEALNRIADATEAQLDIEVQKASAIVQVSETIIKTAEVENQFIAITKTFGSGFVPVVNDKPTLLQLVKTKTEEKEKTPELFDVDKEKNWLTEEPGKVIEANKYDMPLAKFGTTGD